MKTTITFNGVGVYNSTANVRVGVIVNHYEYEVNATYNWVTDLFTIGTIGVFGLNQFCRENNLNEVVFGQKIYNNFKRNYKKNNS